MLKVGNAQAFWGDTTTAPLQLAIQCPDLDFLTLDYLSEVSLSILAVQRERDSSMGYAHDFVDVIRSLIPLWKAGHGVRVIANAGGLNPLACAEACRVVLKDSPGMKIGVVYGDDVLGKIPSDKKLVTANAYLGAHPIAKALDAGAQIVITGRIADPSLTVGPFLHHYKGRLDDWNAIAGATVAGHLIECGTQVTGGFTTNWLDCPDIAHIGFPIAEIQADGSCIITKPAGTGGVVNIQTVKEQLLYEIGDPAAYLSPDATVSFLNLKLEEIAPNRVKVSGAQGSPPPRSFKVSATYRAGFRSEAFLTLIGPRAREKALKCAELIWERVKLAGFVLDRTHAECLGSGDTVPGVLNIPASTMEEIVLRIAASDKREDAIQAFSKEIAPLITAGPQGITGYTSGRPHVRTMFGYLPTTIECSLVDPKMEVLTV